MTETVAAVKDEIHRIADKLERQRRRLLNLLRFLPAPAGETETERNLEALDEVTELRSVILCVDEDSLRPALQDLRSVAGERTGAPPNPRTTLTEPWTGTGASCPPPPLVLQCNAMTREQYEQRKQRLEEQLRAGIQLLESAHQAQVRALDLVWMLQAEELAAEPAVLSSPKPEPAPAPAKQEALSEPSPPPHRGTGHLEGGLRAALPRLPERFTRGDVCAALGYEPDRGTLHRLLQELVREGSVRVESVGSGRRATVYRRTDG